MILASNRRTTRPAWALALALLVTVGSGRPADAVPDVLQPPSGHKPFLVGHAEGVQTYSCQVTGGGATWVFVGPSATLVGGNGGFLTSHGAGPTWEAKDGSRVVARRVVGVPSPTEAIPWLLLEATSTTAGPEGGDRLVHTTHIQRINTTSGVAPPAAACDASTAGTVTDVPYTADYVFFKATGAGTAG